MQFLTPLFLIGGLTVIGPILLHLIRKEDSRKIPFSSLMFVTRLPRKSLRRQRLRHLLLLALRVAALLFLVLAFSRPFFTSFSIDPVPVSGHRSVVILLDTSFSMKYGDHLPQATHEAVKILDGLSRQDTVQLVTFSDTAQVLNPPRYDVGQLKAIVREVQPSDRKTNYAQAIKTADQLLASSPNERREIHIISDFQESGWSESQADVSVDARTRLIPHSIPAGLDNAWVQNVQVKETHESQAVHVQVLATIAGPQTGRAIRSVVTLQLKDKILQEKPVILEPGQTTSVDFASFLVPPGVSVGKVGLRQSDPLPADNTYRFCLNPERKLKLLVAVRNRNAQDHFHLIKALTAGPESPFSIEVREIRGVEPDLSSYAVVLIHHPSSLPRQFAAAVEEFVRQGGGLVIAVGPETSLRDLDQQLGPLLPAHLKSTDTVKSFDKAVFPGEMNRDHPVFNLFQPVHRSYFVTTPFFGYVVAEPKPSARVLAAFENGRPLIMEQNLEKGRVLLLASTLGLDASELPLKSVYLPFCHQLVKYASAQEEPPPAYVVGTAVPLVRLNPYLSQALNKIARTSGSFRQTWKVVQPSGDGIEFSDSDLTASPVVTLEQAGLYETKVHNFTQYVAVNNDPAESNLKSLDPQVMLASVKTVARNPGPALAAGDGPEARLISEQRQRLWWYLVMSALALLLIETFVSNRYYRLKTGV
ncbi:MAG: VWA domain-containing protein [Acidobacteriota bacterium]